MNSISKQFEEWVLRNRDSIKKSCLNTLYVENRVGIKGTVLEKKVSVNSEIIHKWGSIVESFFKKTNISLRVREYICLYCEILHLFSQSSYFTFLNPIDKINIDVELNEIYNKIINGKIRSKIIDKYYNYLTGETEYLLEDGRYVPIDGDKHPILEIDLSILPTELLMIIDDVEYRNNKIDQLI
jgi:hypothetical protein